MNNLSYSDLATGIPEAEPTECQDVNILRYQGRGAGVDVRILPCREGTTLKISGQVRELKNGHPPVKKLTVELLDQLGTVATTPTSRDGSFQFDGLASGVYHMRITDGHWKMGVLGLTV